MIGQATSVKQYMLALTGTFVAAIGIRLIVVSGSGADAMSTFLLGLMEHVPLRFGTVSTIFNGLVLVIIFFYDRQLVGIGSIIKSIGLGICLNLIESAGLLLSIPDFLDYPAVIAGTVLLGMGTGIYLLANAGSAAYDSLMIVVQRLLKVSVKTARIILDGSFFLAGYLLGGTIGLGTLIVLLLMGPSLELTLKHLPKIKLFRTKQSNGTS